MKLDLPAEILKVLALFSPVFSQPIYKNMVLLLVGHVLCNGRRTIADVLRRLNLKDVKNFSKFHWVLSGAKWCAIKAGRILFLEVVKSMLAHGEEIVIPIDATVERRKGPKIKGLGRQRDAVRSTKGRKVLTIGDLKGNNKHKKLTEWAAQLPGMIRSWVGKQQKFVIVGDQGFACYKIAHACTKVGASLVSRLRLDARIFDFPSPKIFRKGRPRLVGNRLPIFSEYLKDDTLAWQEVEVNWYNGKKNESLSTAEPSGANMRSSS